MLGQLNVLMLVSCFILFMINLYKEHHVRASVNVLFKKNFSSETIDWIFTKFHRDVPYIEVENCFLPLQ